MTLDEGPVLPDPPRRRSRRRWSWPIVFSLIVILAATVRFYAIGRRSFWFDEGLSLGMARLPLADLLRNSWNPRLNNQILYYLLLWPWHAFGEAESTVRAFSAVFSIGAVVVLCILGRELFGTAAGLVAGAVLALHPNAIWFAQEARAYSLTTFLVCLSALFLAQVIRKGRRRDVVCWSAASVLALYSHFFALFVVGAQVFSVFALGRRDLAGRAKGIGAGVVAIGVLASPIAAFSLFLPSGLSLYWVMPLTYSRFTSVAAFLAGGKMFLFVFYVALFAVVAANALGTRQAERRWGMALALAWAIIPVLAMSAASIGRPILVERYLLASVPGWALSCGIVVGPLMERRRLAALAYAITGFILIAEVEGMEGNYTDAFEDWRTPAFQVSAVTRPGDAILYESPWAGLAFGYYLDRAPRQPERLQAGPLLFSGTFDVARAAERERVWLVLSRENEPQADCLLPEGIARLHRELVRSHPIVSAFDYGPLKILLYDERARSLGEGAFGRPLQ